MLEILATHVHPSARVATARALAPGKLSLAHRIPLLLITCSDLI